MTTRARRLQSLMAQHEVDAFVSSSATNRRYLTGFTGSAGTVVIGREAAFLLVDFRYVEQAKAQAPGFEIVHYDDLYKRLGEVLSKLKAQRVAFEAQHVTVAAKNKMEEKLPGVSWVPVESWVENLRAVKEPAELAAMEAAVALADRAFEYIIPRLKGRTEKEVAFDLEFFMRKEGASKLAFDIIVASGENGALPHARPTDRVISTGDLVTLDFGCVVDGYCSDMTRTVAVGKSDGRQREIYQLVLEAQQTGVKAVQPGKAGKEVDAAAREVIAGAGYGEQFGHGLGHGVGLEVHERPPVLSKLGEELLQEGMVTSVEPGIYIPGWGGVRIEDLVVVTSQGCRVLTQSPKELIHV
jgi:Xaa-Pro aminopeptidase